MVSTEERYRRKDGHVSRRKERPGHPREGGESRALPLGKTKYGDKQKGLSEERKKGRNEKIMANIERLKKYGKKENR